MIKPAAHVFYIGDEDLPITAAALAALYEVPLSEVEKYAALYCKNGALHFRAGSAAPVTFAGTSTNPTGNTLWVDRINGNDPAALRGRFDRTFLTNAAAKAAALAGDSVVVLPGTYDENNLLKHGVAWQFFANAAIDYTGGPTQAIFDDLNTPITATVAGNGRFYNRSGGFMPSVLRIEHPLSSIHFEADYVGSGDTTLHLKGGESRIAVKTIDGYNGVPSCINVEGGSHWVNGHRMTSIGGGIVTSGGELTLVAGSIDTDEAGVSMTGGTVQLECVRLTASYYSLNVTGGTLRLRSQQISSAFCELSGCNATIVGASIESALSIGTGATVSLRDCIIRSPIIVNGAARVDLHNCRIVAGAGAEAIISDAPQTIYGWGTVRDTPLHPNVTLLGTNNTEDPNLI